MVRVLVTRPEPGASRTLNALIARGVDAVSIPLTEIRPLAFEAPSFEFDALIITSQNAIIHGAPVLNAFKHLPIFAVGSRTAETLRHQGHHIFAWAETAQDLLPMIVAQRPKHALYICVQTRRPELEAGLKSSSIAVFALETYHSVLSMGTGNKLAAFFNGSTEPLILFHAPSAVDALIMAMEHQNLPTLNLPTKTQFLCMSQAILSQLPEHWQSHARISARPDEAAMIDMLDKMLAQSHLPQA